MSGIAPQVLRTEQTIQLCHEVPHRINSAAVYPASSPNGSKIIIYGTDNGVELLWRGGKAFKTPAPSKEDEAPRINGVKDDAHMIIDSDDEEPPSGEIKFDDTVEFEVDEEELDPQRPYPSILQKLTLGIGAAVRHVAVPPTAVFDHHDRKAAGILAAKIVFVVACADRTVRVITLPLLPPSPASKARAELGSSSLAASAGNGLWGEDICALQGHSRDITAVAITLTTTDRILVASHSKSMNGLLLIHHLVINKDGESFRLPGMSAAPSQTQYLSSPAISLDFNPSPSSTANRTQLLMADRAGACKIYDTQLAATVDVAPSSYATQGGSWLLTLRPGFTGNSNKAEQATINGAAVLENYGRKSILDVRWIAGGKAILILLADGEWGVWDLEGVQPGLPRGMLGHPTMRGGAITPFALSGWIEGSPAKTSTRNINRQSTANNKFAPMTPGARRAVEPTLFGGKADRGYIRGQISVTQLPATSATASVDESIAIWMDESYTIIPNIMLYWEAQKNRSGGLFGTSKSASRVMRLTDINLKGDACTSIAQLGGNALGTSAELLVFGEHRFLVVSELARKASLFADRSNTTSRALAPISGEMDTDMDVDGIEAALTAMDHDFAMPGRKAVGFLV